MAEGQTGPLQSDLLWHALRFHKLLIAACGIILLALGLGTGQLLPKTYESAATVIIVPLNGNPYSPQGRGDDLLNLASEIQLVTADAVVTQVAELLTTDDLDSVRDQVSIQVPPNTQTLQISFTARTPEAARQGAAAFADTYLKYRSQRAEAILEGKLKQLEAQSAKVDTSLRNVTKQLSSSNLSAARKNYLTQRATQLTDQLAALDEQANDLASTPVHPGQVISSALAPMGSSGPTRITFGASGLLAGLLLGLLIAVAREHRNGPLRDTRFVERLGIPILATVPLPTRVHLLSAVPGGSGEADAGTIRALGVAVLSRMPRLPASLLIAGASKDDASALISADLGIALGHGGTQTVILDTAHVARSNVSALLGLGSAKGLSDLLPLPDLSPEEHDTDTLIRNVSPQLRVLPQGTDLANTSHRLFGRQLIQLVNVFRRSADLVLIAGPPLDHPDGRAMCIAVDAVLLVVTSGRTRRRDVLAACAGAEQTERSILGVVVTIPPTRRQIRQARKQAKRTAVPAREVVIWPPSEPEPAREEPEPIQEETERSPGEPETPEETITSLEDHHAAWSGWTPVKEREDDMPTASFPRVSPDTALENTKTQ